MNELWKRLDLIGEKLGVVAQQIYSGYEREAYIEGFQDLIFTGIMIFGGILLIKTARSLLVKANSDEYQEWDMPLFMASGVVGLAAIGCFVASTQYLYAVPGEILNPRYWAIHHLLADFK